MASSASGLGLQLLQIDRAKRTEDNTVHIFGNVGSSLFSIAGNLICAMALYFKKFGLVRG